MDWTGEVERGVAAVRASVWLAARRCAFARYKMRFARWPAGEIRRSACFFDGKYGPYLGVCDEVSCLAGLWNLHNSAVSSIVNVVKILCGATCRAAWETRLKSVSLVPDAASY